MTITVSQKTLQPNEPGRPRLRSAFAMLAILSLLALLSFNSNGILRKSGEDEETGSGFGGTGLQLLPGADSGLGGTGARPFLGYEKENNTSPTKTLHEVRILLQPEPGISPLTAGVSAPTDTTQPALESPIGRTIEIVIDDPYAEGAGSIHITEAIQRSTDINALTLNQHTLSQTSAARPGASLPAAEISTIDAHSEVQSEAASRRDSSLSWARLAAALEQQDSASDGTAPSSNSDGTDAQQPRVNRPQAIRRPVLPHLQRVRPVQRTGLLPPPVRPLRL